MTRAQIAADTASRLGAADLTTLPVVLGFDGFVDDIIDVIHERPNGGAYHEYTRVASLAAFAGRIAATAGHGTNVELVVKRQKLGGNGPIMGNALSILGVPVTYMGAVGDGAGGGIHSVFRDFASRATLLTLADAAHTHALEFDDGKLMMGQLGSLSQITFDQLVSVVGKERLPALCEGAALLGLLNWTMIPAATALWRSFAVEILPRLKHKPRIFVDLADPKKRTQEDLVDALGVLTRLNALGAPVTLGLNEAESAQVAEALNIAPARNPSDVTDTVASTPITNYQLQFTALRTRAAAIRTALALDTVVIHPTAGAVAATASGTTAEFPGPYTPAPKILTGGGDHFNAGFALGQLLALPLEHALCLATATSGYYVRNAASPPLPDLTSFLENIPSQTSD